MADSISNRVRNRSQKRADIKASAQRTGRQLFAGAILAGAGLAAINARSVYAATTITWANPALVSSSSVSSTAGIANITVPTGAYAVGDVIQFSGTTATTNPFGTTSTRYYVVSVSGTTIQVATTPGGTAINATNTTTTSTTNQGQDWFTTTNWTGSVAPNDSGTIANFGTNMASSSVPAVVNGAATAYGLTFGGSANGDLTLVSGASGTSLYALTFATNDASPPKMTLSGGSNAIISLGTSSAGSLGLKIAGTQGLIFNSSAGGAITGSGTAATSTAPGKQIRVANVDWTSFTGGIQIERGLLQLQVAGQLPSQTLTVGDATTTTNNLLAGLNLNGFAATVDGLNGTSLGRIYGASTLTIGNSGGGGTYSGSIGLDFTGAAVATNLAKSGAGTETISGIMGGTGTVTVNANGGTLVLNGNDTYTGLTTINSGGTLQIGNANALGTTAGTTAVASGGTLDLNGQTISEVLSVTGSGVGGLGALINSNTGAAAILNSEITNGASLTVGGAGDMTLQRVRSGGSVITLTKIGAGTLTLGNANTTTHMNLLAVDVESASTVNFNTVSGTNYLVADRGVKIAAGGAVIYTGTSTNMVGDNQEVIVSNGTFNMNGISDTVGRLTIGDGTNNGTVSGAGSTLTVGGSYQAFGQGGTSLNGGIEAMSGTVSVNLAGAAPLNKTTSGAVTLSGSNSYTGLTTISGGVLWVNGSHTTAGAYAVNTGGTLAGNGSIATAANANVTIADGGKLSPGSAAATPGTFTMNLGTGALDISGAVTQTNSQSMLFDLGTTSDKVVLSGATSLNIGSGTLEFDDFQFTDLGGLTSTTYTLFDSSVSIVGTLGSNLSGTISNGVTGTLGLGDSGNDLVLTVAVAPEPTSLSVVGMVGAGLLARRRRRR